EPVSLTLALSPWFTTL
nr:protein p12E - Friend murine leukemia virus (fragments) [Friend murine leukemia virus]